MKIDKQAVDSRLNGLGRYIVDQEDLNFTKVSKHLGISRQAVWLFCHKPSMETLDLKLKTIKSVADIQGVNLASLVKKVLELDNNAKDNANNK